MIKRIISGGQTGVDLGALLAAQYLGIETGGYAPQGWETERGPQKELLQSFGLVECRSPGYPARTEVNVRSSDGTLMLSNQTNATGGTYMTMCVACSYEKPWLYFVFGNPVINERMAIEFLERFDGKILNIAGPRESKWPGAQSLVMDWLIRVFENNLK